MRWIAVCITPQMQDRSRALSASSFIRHMYVTLIHAITYAIHVISIGIHLITHPANCVYVSQLLSIHLQLVPRSNSDLNATNTVTLDIKIDNTKIIRCIVLETSVTSFSSGALTMKQPSHNVTTCTFRQTGWCWNSWNTIIMQNRYRMKLLIDVSRIT